MRAAERSAEEVRAAVVGRLRARQTELVEAIIARVREGALGSAGAEDAEYVAGLRAAVAAAVSYGLQGIDRGAEWAGPIPAAALEQARRAACAGVSLEVVLRRYVAGHTLFGEFVMQEADRGDYPGERSVVRSALRAQASVLDRLLAAVTTEYGSELARAGRSPEQRRCERVKGLLDGGAPERLELDYDFGGWHLGVIAVGPRSAPLLHGLAGDVDRRLLSVAHGQQGVWAWLGGRERFVAPDIERLCVAAPASGDVVLALGEPARGIKGWRLTHRQAQAALLIALRRSRSRAGGVTRYADVALLAFALRDEALAMSLIEIYLTPLDRQRDHGVVSRETLRAYLSAGRSASSAAAALGVARNTVENRLRTVEQSLGRALPTCLAELEVALGLEELDLGRGASISTNDI
jgi:hypothetical protein